MMWPTWKHLSELGDAGIMLRTLAGSVTCTSKQVGCGDKKMYGGLHSRYCH
jgi:hypothetical protein